MLVFSRVAAVAVSGRRDHEDFAWSIFVSIRVFQRGSFPLIVELSKLEKKEAEDRPKEEEEEEGCNNAEEEDEEEVEEDEEEEEEEENDRASGEVSAEAKTRYEKVVESGRPRRSGAR